MKIKILVAMHKQYHLPQDSMYLPIHVGAALHPEVKLSIQRDDEGENISAKNANYCELTALYWAWKNLDADYVGLCHYRRYFRGCRGNNKWQSIMTGTQLEKKLKEAPVLLPLKRNYWIETTYGQYIHAHHRQDLDLTKEILAQRYPEYLPAWDRVMSSTKGHRFNMFVMRRDLFDDYCGWLFDVLGQLEERLDISEYSDYDARVYGFVSERLLDVWVETKKISYREAPVMYMEKQNWLIKGKNFLMRKLKGERVSK